MTKDDRGGEGVWQKMTDDDDEAGGRREKALTALVKVKPFPSEAYKIAPRLKIAMISR